VERTERTPVLSHEHTRFEWIALDEVAGLRMPNGYKRSIARWSTRRGRG